MITNSRALYLLFNKTRNPYLTPRG
jgi:hypothetical protein